MGYESAFNCVHIPHPFDAILSNFDRDAHPTDVNKIIFPGQDYNNARVSDFQDVSKWNDNKLDRTKDARMGWSDLSICLQGPIIEDLQAHFAQRWNYIYREKYGILGGKRYRPLSIRPTQGLDAVYHADGSNLHIGVASQKLAGSHANAEVEDDMPTPAGAFPRRDNEPHHHLSHALASMVSKFRLEDGDQQREIGYIEGAMAVQLTRSCARWSHGISIEVSHASLLIIK